MTEAEQDPAEQPKPQRRLLRLVKRLVVIALMAVFATALAGYLYSDVMRTQKGPHTETVLFDLSPERVCSSSDMICTVLV